MSQTIDNKVVEMRFDNSNFEKNIAQSIKSLQNIEKQINSLDKTKGLEALNESAKKADFSNMQKGLEQTKIKFSALQVAGATAISELTKKAMNFGKTLVKNTVGQIKSGGLTRALNIDQAKFQIEGLGKKWSKVVNGVEKGVKRDVLGAVKGTAYGLDEAARVSSQLLASNVKTGKEMQGVLRGISGVAAMTNSSYSEIGNIFTKVAGNGRLMSAELLQMSARGMNAAATLRDYANANEKVRKKMIAVGLASKKAKDVEQFAKATKLTEGNIRTLVTGGAVNFEIFSKAMNKAFGKQATKANKTYSGALANMNAALSRIGADIQTPKLEALRKIFIALTKVFDDAHDAIQPFLDTIGELFNKTSKSIVKFLKGPGKKATDWLSDFSKRMAGKPFVTLKKWKQLTKDGVVNKTFEKALKRTAKASGISIDQMIKKNGSFKKSLKEGWLNLDIFKKALKSYKDKTSGSSKGIYKLAKSFKDLDKTSNQVIRGSFGNGLARYKALTKAGYDYNAVQGLVNHKLLGTKYNFEKYVKTLDKVSNKQLKHQGYTKKEIKTLRKLQEESKKTGTPINKLIKSLSKPTPFEATINAIAIALKSAKKIIGAFGGAFKEVFFGSKKKTNIVDTIEKITDKLKINDKTVKNLKDTFKGLFAAIDIVRMVLAFPLKIAVKIIGKILGNFNIGILDATAYIGDLLVKFRKWIKDNKVLNKVIDVAAKVLSKIIKWVIKIGKTVSKYSKILFKGPIDSIKKFVKEIKENQNIDFSILLGGFSNFGDNLKNILSTIKNNIRDTLDSKGILKAKTFDKIIEFFKNTFKKISSFISTLTSPLQSFKDKITEATSLKSITGNKKLKANDIIDVKSFKKYGFIVDDIINGVKTTIKNLKNNLSFKPIDVSASVLGDDKKSSKSGSKKNTKTEKKVNSVLDNIKESLTKFKDWFKDFFKSIDFYTVAGVAGIVGTFAIFFKILKQINALTTPFNSIASNINKNLKTIRGNLRVERFTKVITSVALLAGALFLLSKVPTDKLIEISVVLILLTGALAAIAKWADNSSGFKQVGAMSKTIIALAASTLILAIALKKISKIAEGGHLADSLWALGGIMASLGGLVVIVSKYGSKIETGTMQLLAISISIRILVSALNALNDMNISNVYEFLTKLTLVLGIMFTVLAMSTMLGVESIASAAAILAITVSMLLLVRLIKVLDELKLSLEDGISIIGKLSILLGAMFGILKLTKYMASDAKGAALTVLAFGVAFLAIVTAIKFLRKAKWEDIGKGIVLMAGFSILLSMLIFVTKWAGPNAKTVMMTLLSFAAVMVILVSIIAFVGGMDDTRLLKGIAVVVGLGLLIKALLKASKGAAKVQIQKIWTIVGALFVLTLCVALLSKMDPVNVMVGTASIALLGTIIVLMVKYSERTKKLNPKSFWQLIGAIMALTACVVALSLLDPVKVGVGVAAIAALGTIVVALTKYSERTKKLNWKSFWQLMLAIGLLTVCVAALSLLDPVRVITGTLCVVALGVLVIAMTKLAENTGKIAVASLFIMIASIAILAGIVYLLGTLNPTNVITATACVIALGALAIIMTNVASAVGTEAIPGLLLLSLAVGIIGLVLYALASLPNANEVAGIAASIAILMVGLSAALVLCAAVGALAEFAIIGLGVVLIALAAITLVIVTLGALADDIGPFIEKGGPLLVKIGSYIGQFLGAFIGGIATQAASALPVLGAALGAFGIGIRPFIDSMKDLPLDFVLKIAGLIAAILAITAAGFLNKITSFLSFGSDPIDEFVSTMIKLGKGLKKFNATIEGVDATGADKAATVLLKLSECANLIPRSGGWLQKIVGNKDLDGFGAGVVSMAKGLKTFVQNIDTSIDAEKYTPYVNLIKKVAEIANLIPRSGGWLQDLVGNKDLAGFGDAIKPLAKGIKSFAKQATEIEDPDALNNIIGIVKKMVEVQDDLPRSGGLWQGIAGEKDWSSLSEGLTSMIDCFKSISKTIGGKVVNLDIIKTVTDILTQLTSISTKAIKIDDAAQKKKQKTGSTEGFVDSIMSPVKTAMTKIKEYQKTLKEEDLNDTVTYFAILKNFINRLGDTFSDKKTQENLKIVKKIGDSITALFTAVNNIKGMMKTSKSDKKKKGDDDQTSLNAFADAVIGFNNKFIKFDTSGVDTAASIADKIRMMGSIKISKFEGVKTSVENIKAALLAFKDATNKKNRVDPEELGEKGAFTKYVNDMRKAINRFANSFGEKSIKNLEKVKDFGSKAKTFGDGLKQVAEAFKNINSTTVTKNKGKEVSDAMIEVAKASVNNFTKGLKGDKADPSVKTAFNALLNKVRDYAKANHPGTITDMKDAGINVAQGFINGLDSMKESVKGKLKEIMEASIEVTMKTLDENSPSKVFDEIGQNLLQGQINGILRKSPKLLSTLKMVNANAIKTSAEIVAKSLGSSVKVVDSIINSINSNIDKTNKEYTKSINNNIKAIKKLRKQIKNKKKAKKKLNKKKDKTKINKLKHSIKKKYKTINRLKDNNKDLAKKRANNAKKKITFAYGTNASKNAFINAFKPKVTKKNAESYARSLSSLFSTSAASLYQYTNPKEYDKYTTKKNAINKSIKTSQNLINGKIKGIKSLKKKKVTLINHGAQNVPKKHKVNAVKARKENKKELKKARAELKSLKKKRSNTKNSTKRKALKNSINTTKDTIRNLKKDRKKINKALKPYDKAKANIKAKNKELTDLTKDFSQNVTSVVTEMTDTIKDNLHSFLDPLSNTVDTGINLFEKFEKGARISAGRLTANMESQVKAAADYAKDIARLENTGLSQDVINQIKSEGISGWSKVKAALVADDDQISRMNAAAASKHKISLQTIMKGLMDRIRTASDWNIKLEALASRGIDPNILKDILSMGIEEAGPYIDALLQASPEQLREFNRKFKEAQTLEKNLSSAGFAYYARATQTSKLLEKQGEHTGWKYSDGLLKGLTDKNHVGKLVNAASAIGDYVKDSVDETLGIHSPATTGIRSGKFEVLGLVKGIKDNINLAKDAAGNLADAVLNPIDNLPNSEDPTITPILDLSRLEADLKELESMFKSPYTLDIAASVAKVGTGSVQTVNNGDIVNNYHNEFTQNNYSPKALDEAEIYRKNKNFINSKMRGGVVTQ